MAESKGYDISKGTETGLKILCETTAKQNQILKQGRPLLNRGRIVLITHFRDQHHLLKVLEAFRKDFREINEVIYIVALTQRCLLNQAKFLNIFLEAD